MKSNKHQITLRLPADADYVDIVRLTLYGVAVKMGFSFEEIEDMKVAVSEACNNCVLHAYNEGESGYFEVRFEQEDGSLRIVVKDEGISYDAQKAVLQASPLHNKELKEVQTGGLGIYLMQALMDNVQVHSDGGTEVVLTKRLIRNGELV